MDGNGSIVANDFSEVKKRFFDGLPPAPSPAAVAGSAGDDDETLSGSSVTNDLFASQPIVA